MWTEQAWRTPARFAVSCLNFVIALRAVEVIIGVVVPPPFPVGPLTPRFTSTTNRGPVASSARTHHAVPLVRVYL